MIHFIGHSFAARNLKTAARDKGIPLTDDINEASLIFVSEDTPTDSEGNRDLDLIRRLIPKTDKPIVLTSQVPVGFTRSLGIENIWHQAETLRIKDAALRAMYPDQIIVGGSTWNDEYNEYLYAFKCPIHWMTWEEAEFSKIAINLTLISQVENTNRLYEYSEELGLRWSKIKEVLGDDHRIGKMSYLEPGNWADSPHLLRDWVTFESS